MVLPIELIWESLSMKIFKPAIIIFLFAVTIIHPLNGQPVITVDPDEFSFSVYTGASETQMMNITNNGSSELEYTIEIDGTNQNNYCLEFNGVDSYVYFENTSIETMIGPNWAYEKTISAWVKPHIDGSSDDIFGAWNGAAVYGQISGSGNFFGISIGIIDGEDRIWVYNWDGSDDRIGIEYERGEWAHIALVHDNGTLYGYKNGELIGSVYTGASGGAGTQMVGGGTDNGRYFEGSIDDVRVWDIARSQQDILDDYLYELNGDEQNLVGYWKFNEADGETAYDQTGQENNGFIYEASWMESDATFGADHWLSIDPLSGSISSSQSQSTSISVNALDLSPNLYESILHINSNDADQPQVDIPVALNVESAPHIIVNIDTLNFDTVFAGYQQTLNVGVLNQGSETLNVTATVSSDGQEFVLNNTDFSIMLGESEPIPVTFQPTNTGDYIGALSLSSNDPDADEIIVVLAGISVDPPVIVVSPDSLSADLYMGETETQTLQVANNGSSDLNFSINLLNSDTTSHRLEFEPGNRPRLSIQDIQNFWNSEHEYSSSSSGIPSVTTSTRTTRSWQLLANDPQDNNSPYDTENIYYELTDTTHAFKYEYYEPWEDAAGNTVCIMYIDLDNDLETGATIEFDDEIEGIDVLIYSFGDDGFDGTYLYEADNDQFVFYEQLMWRVAEDSTNEFSFAVNNELFEGLTSSRMVSLSGSFAYEPDIVPNEGMLDLLFQPPWISVVPLDSVVAAGSVLDLSVIFDASGMFGGEYYADIVIASNDPEDPEVVVPAHLSVTGASDIWVDPDTVDFGVMFVNYGGTLDLELGNDGTDVLNVSSITVDNT
ncbi:uncharacterized protein METZ01_LOCUS137722, partial [marine metagenome]